MSNSTAASPLPAVSMASPAEEVIADRYGAVVEAMQQGYCVLQVILDETGRPSDYRFLETNHAFTDHTGLVDPVGRTARELVPGLEDSWIDVYGHVALHRQPRQFEDCAEAMGPRWFDVTAFPLGDPADLLVGLIFVDITAQRMLERAQSDLLAMVSHDLRSPLTALRGRAQLMRRRQAYDDRSLELMLDQILRIDRLIGDLQDVVRADAGAIDLQIAPWELGRILRDAADRASTAWSGRIVVDLPDRPIDGQWDGARLGQIFDNLLSNAIKYSPDGSVVTVRASLDASTSMAQVSVVDVGPGIPREAQGRLFERFYRADAARAQTGLGLGLYITRMLVRAHGGEISVLSGEGEGSTFTLTLPLDATMAVPIPSAPD